MPVYCHNFGSLRLALYAYVRGGVKGEIHSAAISRSSEYSCRSASYFMENSAMRTIQPESTVTDFPSSDCSMYSALGISGKVSSGKISACGGVRFVAQDVDSIADSIAGMKGINFLFGLIFYPLL